MRKILLRAPVDYNGLGNPRLRGAVVIQEALDASTVVAVGDADELIAAFPDVEIQEEPFALSPAPVNAHTHLDLSAMPYQEGSYEQFIAAVIAHGREGGRSLASAQEGVAELLAGGTRTVGDIVTNEEVMRFLLSHEELRGVAYWEVVGPDPEDAARLLAETEALVQRFRDWERPEGMKVGLAPHTPHTVSAPLMRGLAALATRYGLPFQIHLAEAPGELELHRDGSGPLAAAMQPWLRDWEPSGLTPVGYLASLGVLEARPTLVHMVHVSDEDIRLVQRNSCSVVHCPRSNLALGCGRFPWERYARQGVNIALGTDSRGSSPTLAVEDEVASALELHGDRAGPQALVRAAVKGGHRALGMVPPRFVRGDDARPIHAWRSSGLAESDYPAQAGRVHGMT